MICHSTWEYTGDRFKTSASFIQPVNKACIKVFVVCCILCARIAIDVAKLCEMAHMKQNFVKSNN